MKHNIEINDGILNIGKSNYFHVEEVEVFTSNDGFHPVETGCISIKRNNSSPGELSIFKRISPKPILTTYSSKNEPGVRMFLKSENTGETIVLQLCHHKGHLFVDYWVDGQDKTK